MKKKWNKKLIPLLWLIGLTMVQLAHAKKTEYENVIIFGDSLSDPGSSGPRSRYVSGGADHPGYFDVLSNYYADKPSTYIGFGGTNYAASASSIYAVNEQVKSYVFEHNGGKVNRNNLHVLWVGGSDINTAFIFNVHKLPFYNLNQADFTLYNKNNKNPTHVIAESAKLLIDHGAPYVVAGSLPNASYAPITSMFHVDITVTLLSSIIPPPFNREVGLQIRKFIGNFLDNRLRPINTYGQGTDFIRNFGIEALKIQLPFIPRFMITAIYDTITNIETNLTRQFNYSTEQALLPLNGHIVYADSDKMFSEFLENPGFFGIDRITLTSCSLSYASSYCSKAENNYFDDLIYAFGDWFHPSSEGHSGIAHYIISLIDAPNYIASIISELNNINQSSQTFLQSNLSDFRPHLADNPLNQWTVFGGYSGSFNRPSSYIDGDKKSFSNLLNIGFINQLNANWSLGLLLSLSFGKSNPYQQIKFRQNTQNLLLFTEWVASDQRFWFNANINVGQLNAKNIKRSIKILKGNIVETADSTKSKMFGFNTQVGWNILAAKENYNFQTGPYLGLSFNHYKLNGFSEQKNRSTSMRFNSTDYNHSYATVGWFINGYQFESQNKPISISAKIAYNQDIKREDLIIPSGIKSTPLLFNKKVESDVDKWIDIQSNLNIASGKDTAVNLGLGFKIDNKKGKNVYYSLGIKHEF